jgi:hypothetical protein
MTEARQAREGSDAAATEDPTAAGRLGDRPEGVIIDADGVDTSGGGLSHVATYEGDAESGGQLDDVSGRGGAEHLEMLEDLELRGDETSDPNEAAEEGMTWVPPIDPPVVADREDPEGVTVAAGFGVSAMDEPYDFSHRDEEDISSEGELNELIRDALRSDAATSRWADMIVVGVRGDTVVLRGMVEDLDDTDEVVAVVERVTGVGEVIDEIQVRALEP